MTAIAIHHLSKTYHSAAQGSVQALADVSFEIQEGEFFALLGANGAGKSTLINTIAGLVRPSAGSVRILGCDVIQDFRRARQLIGIVPQEIAYDPFFTVRESLTWQLGYMGRKLKDHQDWLDELIVAMGLEDKANARVKWLSGGMKRRVLIAQALVHRPKVVVLDEPTAGVDVGLRQTLWQFIKDLHRRGHTIVLTTHYLEEAEELCSRFAIIDHGKLCTLANKQELLQMAPTRRVSIRVANGSPAPWAAYNPYWQPIFIKSTPSEQGAEVQFQLQNNSQAMAEFLQELTQAQVQIADIQTQQVHLEEVFLHITAGGRQHERL